MKVFFVRHGQTHINATKHDPSYINYKKEDMQCQYKDNTEPLNEKGIEQAEITGKYLNTFNYNFDLIISSPAKRCIETAKIIMQEIKYTKYNNKKEIKIDVLLEEKIHPSISGLTIKENNDLNHRKEIENSFIHQKLKEFENNIDPFIKYNIWNKYSEEFLDYIGAYWGLKYIKKHNKFIKKLKKLQHNDNNIKCILIVGHGTTLSGIQKIITNTMSFYNQVHITNILNLKKCDCNNIINDGGNTSIMACLVENNEMKLIIPQNTLHLSFN